jgi:hypothetical protein
MTSGSVVIRRAAVVVAPTLGAGNVRADLPSSCKLFDVELVELDQHPAVLR